MSAEGAIRAMAQAVDRATASIGAGGKMPTECATALHCANILATAVLFGLLEVAEQIGDQTQRIEH